MSPCFPMQDASLHSHFKSPGFAYHDGAVGVTKAQVQRSAQLQCGSEVRPKPNGAEELAVQTQAATQRSHTSRVAALRAEAAALLAQLQHTDEFACERPTIGPAAPYLAQARRWLATVAALPASARARLRPEQSLLTRLTL